MRRVGRGSGPIFFALCILYRLVLYRYMNVSDQCLNIYCLYTVQLYVDQIHVPALSILPESGKVIEELRKARVEMGGVHNSRRRDGSQTFSRKAV